MTREEAIQILKDSRITYVAPNGNELKKEALNKAIEALSQPIVAKHFDIQSGYIYCSPQIAENVKVVVRCKDCLYKQYDVVHNFCEINHHKCYDDDFCCWGERREE